MLARRRCPAHHLINPVLQVVGKLRILYVSPLEGFPWDRTDVSVDFVDILAKLDKINRITDGW